MSAAPQPQDPAQTVHQVYHEILVPALYAPIAEELAKKFSVGDEVRMLEVGCGTGALTQLIASKLEPGSKFTATDNDASALALARDTINRREIRYGIEDVTKLSFSDASFDAVASNLSFSSFPDAKKALREMFRVLEPGGLVLFSTWAEQKGNPAFELADNLMRRTILFDRPRHFEAPFSYCNEAQIRSDVLEAGFGEPKIIRTLKEVTFASAKDLAYGLMYGTTASEAILKRETIHLEQFLTSLERLLGNRYGYEPITYTLEAFICYAQVPQSSE